MLLALACIPTHQESPLEIPAGWTLGEPQTCQQPHPGWSDQSSLIGESHFPIPTSNQRVNPEPGGLALSMRGGDWTIAWTQPLNSPIDCGSHQLATPRSFQGDPALGFASDDLDQDGEVDLVTFGVRSYITWSYGTDHAVEQAINEDGSSSLPRDVVPADFDGDGYRDLLIFNSPLWFGEVPELVIGYGTGGRQFSTQRVLEGGEWGHTFDAQVFDFDADGDPDIFLCHDGGTIKNQLVLNEGERGFVLSEDALGLGLGAYCMGVAVGDINADGEADFYLSDVQRHLLMASSEEGLVEASSRWGLPAPGETQMGWGAAFADLGNDGMQDLLVATSDFYVADPVLWPLWYFRQERDQLVELGLFPQRTATRGLVVRDINGDGVLDVLAGDAYRSPYLFLSNGCTVSNWIEVEAPPMTRVEVEAGGRTFVSWALAESSWASTAPSVAHIGLGTIETVDAITLTPVWGEPTTVQGPIQARRKVLFSPG